ncbi:MAG: DUF3168 domain-containing protein [Bacteroidia bacterium]|jgi:hypothetical protein
MSADNTLYTLLNSNVAVAAVVSDRIFPLYETQEALPPFISFQQIANRPSTNKSGPSPTDTLFYQVNSVAKTFIAARSLAELVRTALDFQASESIKAITFSEETTMWSDDAGLEGYAGIAQTYEIRYNR